MFLRGLRLELRMPSHAYSHCSIGDALLKSVFQPHKLILQENAQYIEERIVEVEEAEN